MAADSALSDHARTKLLELFTLLDTNGDGELSIEEFKRLGKVITGRDQTDEETAAQIGRADKDQNGGLSVDEWLEFSSMLGRLSREEFDKVIGSYIESIKAEQAK